MSLPTPKRDLRLEKKIEEPIQKEIEDIRYKPSDLFEFDPKPDITAFELAQLFQAIRITMHHDIYEKQIMKPLPHLKKHFRRVKIA